MTPALLIVGALVVGFLGVIFGLAGWSIAADAEQERDAANARARTAESSLADLWMDRYEDQAKAAMPLDAMVGTVANPIQLDRVAVDSALNDTARFELLDSLVRSTGGRLL